MTVKFKCNKKIMIIMLKLSQFVRSRCVIAEKKDSMSYKTLLVLTEKSKISLVILSFSQLSNVLSISEWFVQYTKLLSQLEPM